ILFVGEDNHEDEIRFEPRQRGAVVSRRDRNARISLHAKRRAESPRCHNRRQRRQPSKSRQSTVPAGPIASRFNGSVNDAVKLTNGGDLIAGTSNGDFAVARETASGALDTSFSGDGKLTTDLGSTSDSAYGVTQMPNGKII